MDLSLAEASARVGLTPQEIAKALATYVRSILSGDSRYDRFLNGDQSALTEEEQRGLQIFRGKGNCTACHVGPNLSDEQLHNTGVAWKNSVLDDMGAGQGNFKTPTLRELPKTAPYMHDGSLATIEDVIDFYSDGGRNNPNLDEEIRPLNLTAKEKQSLASFLRALEGKLADGMALRVP
jgi:cytochrome c peroxidase